METLWFCIVAFMITGYVVLDGFDIGAGIIHLLVARDGTERRKVIKSIGPVWDGNEVWLIAGGGTLYFAFPKLYASSFAGFYLPLMMVLWLLILRAIALEFRGHLTSPTWTPFWDAVFGGASTVLAIFYGAALGNVIRGVPLDADGDFFLPLWTNFRAVADAGILDWFTILVGLLAALTLTMHGALWVTYKTDGDLRVRSLRCAKLAWFGVAGLTALVTIATFIVQPQVLENFNHYPFGFFFPVIALGGLVGVRRYVSTDSELAAFLSSCGFVVGMMTSAAFGIFPYVLPSNANPDLGLTIYNSATSAYSMKVGLAWWIPGMILAFGYFVFIYRKFAGKVRLEEGGH